VTYMEEGFGLGGQMRGTLQSLTTVSTCKDDGSDTLVQCVRRGGARDATAARVDGAGPRTLAGRTDEMAMVGAGGGR
jgi:hypothetical protein